MKTLRTINKSVEFSNVLKEIIENTKASTTIVKLISSSSQTNTTSRMAHAFAPFGVSVLCEVHLMATVETSRHIIKKTARLCVCYHRNSCGR